MPTPEAHNLAEIASYARDLPPEEQDFLQYNLGALAAARLGVDNPPLRSTRYYPAAGQTAAQVWRDHEPDFDRFIDGLGDVRRQDIFYQAELLTRYDREFSDTVAAIDEQFDASHPENTPGCIAGAQSFIVPFEQDGAEYVVTIPRPPRDQANPHPQMTDSDRPPAYEIDTKLEAGTRVRHTEGTFVLNHAASLTIPRLVLPYVDAPTLNDVSFDSLQQLTNEQIAAYVQDMREGLHAGVELDEDESNIFYSRGDGLQCIDYRPVDRQPLAHARATNLIFPYTLLPYRGLDSPMPAHQRVERQALLNRTEHLYHELLDDEEWTAAQLLMNLAVRSTPFRRAAD